MTDNNFGRRLANRYELMDSIGQGSMGKVYLAKDTLLGGVPVAVKFLAQTLLNEQMTQRFMHEAMTCAQLGNNSIHVVRVTDYGVADDGVPFYVMEYLKGKNLGQVIQSHPLPVKRFLDFTRQICLGLQTAHKGIILDGQLVPIIHRDIKPSNILVTQSASVGELVKVLDFGIAKLTQAGISEQTSSFLGTLAYASPEQMEGQELDSRSDIYSLGVMMYQMLTGTLPLCPKVNTFGGWYKAHRSQEPTPLDGLSPYGTLPQRLKEAVMGCLAKERSRRPTSVSHLLAHLEGAVDSPMSAFLRSAKDPEELPQESEEERFYRQQVWPKDKPIAEIVFPKLLTMGERQLPTLWVMLSAQEIEQRVSNTGYNNFLCTLNPHPMVLWVTAFHSKVQGPRWLSSYLDLKNPYHGKIIWHLGGNGSYRVLFFAKDFPNQFVDSRRLHIAPPQRKLLKEWVLRARTTISVGSSQDSKSMLRKELNTNLKPQMLW
ncbi:serine/threonine protein kinase [Leptolyngbyaceae cyanobacterium CCMR0082]|uniref:Serine/threonine protein kinase n=2 Tax=Adonisia turfae TaxID=2950184 RepID=A0A6M0S4B2_9CYAN|nr:serine/threonine-protein kinase [Adonisia turfae]MDV3349397.1 serine/threonine-protein kinase [Leptothoe sp. LEGE 181152]NEZ58306.1 serine/threonine protein kinase [Adonisia turfae CCMR0081]NEZ62811.1 serine/threonine protein kinase [Adonisia turfae CCMR0082]